MTINERILALRRAAGLSQEALAEQVGVSRQAIGKWESGASLPGLDNLQELARALGVSCDELLTGKESGTENTAGQDGVALESVKALLDAQNAAQAHAAHRQRILHAGIGRAILHNAVLFKDAVADAPVMHERHEVRTIVGAILADREGDFIRNFIAVGIAFLDGLEHVVQILSGLGRFKVQLVQPILTIEVDLRAGNGGTLANEANVAVAVHDLAADVGIAVHGP